jgi:hypothetical protein
MLAGSGSVVLGYAFLQPGPWGRFKDLPVRRDVAEALLAQGLTVLRYGGSMVNIDTYRWKNMIVQHNREVWFDVPVGTDQPDDPDGLGGIPSLIEALRRIGPQARYKVAVFELNAGNHALGRALSNAHALKELERLGDSVPVVCSANCLQPEGQNENGGDQGLLFLNPSQVWAQPPYYVTQMVSAHYAPLRLEATVRCPDHTLDVTARRREDGRTVVLSVVNVAAHPRQTRIRFPASLPPVATAQVTTLTGDLKEINTPDQPRRIAPTQTIPSLSPDDAGTGIVYTFPAHSFTILRVP